MSFLFVFKAMKKITTKMCKHRFGTMAIIRKVCHLNMNLTNIFP